MANTQYHLIFLQSDSALCHTCESAESKLGKLNFSDIRRSTVIHIQKQLDKVVNTSRSQSELDIWLHSPGGDAHATYKLFLDLRSRFKKIRAVVPDCAKSAATLLLLGADEIYMAPSADLGPLDIQLSHPDRETEVVSGLDIKGSLDYLNEFAIQMAILDGAALCRYSGLSRAEVLKDISDFTAKFLQPCVAKIDPHLTRRVVFQLQIAERYAMDMLERRELPKPLSKDTARNLVKQLVSGYPVHEFVISPEEAKKLGLPVQPITTYPFWRLVKSTYDMFLASDSSMINVFKHKDLIKAASSKQPRPAGQVKKRNPITRRTSNGPKLQQASRAVSNGSHKSNEDAISTRTA